MSEPTGEAIMRMKEAMGWTAEEVRQQVEWEKAMAMRRDRPAVVSQQDSLKAFWLHLFEECEELANV